MFLRYWLICKAKKADCWLRKYYLVFISTVNWCEVVQKLRAWSIDDKAVYKNLMVLGLRLIPFSLEHADKVGELWQVRAPLGLSLSDRALFAFTLEPCRAMERLKSAWVLTLPAKILNQYFIQGTSFSALSRCFRWHLYWLGWPLTRLRKYSVAWSEFWRPEIRSLLTIWVLAVSAQLLWMLDCWHWSRSPFSTYRRPTSAGPLLRASL